MARSALNTVNKLSQVYDVLDAYVIRTPLVPLKYSMDFLTNVCNKEYLLNFIENPTFREALQLASPDLVEALSSSKFTGNPYSKDNQKLLVAVIKYATRMGSRSTPFGLFAGIALGFFGDCNRILKAAYECYNRRTTLDSEYYEDLLTRVRGNKELWKYIKWFTNSTLFCNGEEIRWLDSGKSSKEAKFSFQSSIRSEALDVVIEQANHGAFLLEMVELLQNLGYSGRHSRSYIFTLINNGVLVSNLDRTVFDSGDLPPVIRSLINLPNAHLEAGLLASTQSYIVSLDQRNTGDDNNHHLCDREEINFHFLRSATKTPFMVDVFPNFMSNQLNRSLKQDLLESLDVINLFSPSYINENYTDFLIAFKKRYDRKSVRLVDVLDTDYGIGYPADHYRNINTYIDQFDLKPKTTVANTDHKLSAAELLLQEKIKELTTGLKTLVLEDKDIKTLPPVPTGLRTTFFGLAEFLEMEGKIFVHPISFGGSSASVLLSRFAYSHNGIHKHFKEIVSLEQEGAKECLHAEMTHFPFGKPGNIVKRPNLREYSISYMDGSGCKHKNRINIEDLYLKLEGGKLVLRSKSLGKQVIPYLSTAYDHNQSSLPFYSFLGDFQFAGKRPYLYFSWGALKSRHKHLPRVLYKNCILSKALWSFTKTDVTYLTQLLKNTREFEDKIKNWVNQAKLPRYVQLIQEDNKLLIDTQNMASMQTLILSVGKMGLFELEEFLQFPNSFVVNEQNQGFASEFQFSFYKNKQPIYEKEAQFNG